MPVLKCALKKLTSAHVTANVSYTMSQKAGHSFVLS